MSPKKPATYQDLVDLPDDVLGQILDGELVATPKPALEHQHIAWLLSHDLGPFLQRGRSNPGGWWFAYEPELHFGGDVLVPDLAGWRIERRPRTPAPFATVAPDWLCEVLSPSTASIDRVRKMPIYWRQGVQHVWLVNPRRQSLEVYRYVPGQEPRWDLTGSWSGDQRARAEPLSAVELNLAEFWTQDGPPATP